MLSSVDISATQYRDIRKSKLLFIHILLHSLYYYYFVVLICEFFFGPWMYKCWMNSLNRRLNEIHTCLIHAQLVPLWCAVAIFTLIFLYLKSLCWEGSGEGYLSPSDEVMAVCHKSLGTTDTKKKKKPNSKLHRWKELSVNFSHLPPGQRVQKKHSPLKTIFPCHSLWFSQQSVSILPGELHYLISGGRGSLTHLSAWWAKCQSPSKCWMECINKRL